MASVIAATYICEMIFGSSSKHPLPKFPEGTSGAFESLCVALPPSDADLLRGKVEEALEAISKRSKVVPTVDVAMGRAVAAACRVLLDHYANRSDEEKALIVGAVRYFADSDDPLPDTVFATGLDDDAMIVNHVLERLGIEGHYVEIP